MAIQTLTLNVLGMTCGGCATSVQNALNDITGVNAVNVDFAAKQAVIEYDDEQVQKPQLIEAVEDAGFSTT